MLKNLTQILVLIFIMGFAYFLYIIATESSFNAAKVFHVGVDGTVTVIGTVLSNKNSCSSVVSGPDCVLDLRVGNENINVIYGTSNNSICSNETALSKGKQIPVNSQVKVFGFYKEVNNKHSVLTCPASVYYITEI